VFLLFDIRPGVPYGVRVLAIYGPRRDIRTFGWQCGGQVSARSFPAIPETNVSS
jgi:hypothetical protein